MIKTCTYTLEDFYANVWECSKCKEWWILNDGTPEENRMNFCPFCGSKIINNRMKVLEESIG